MTRRLHPFVIRLYDPEFDPLAGQEGAGLDYEGAYMVMGFDGDPDIAALRGAKGAGNLHRSWAGRTWGASRARRGGNTATTSTTRR